MNQKLFEVLKIVADAGNAGYQTGVKPNEEFRLLQWQGLVHRTDIDKGGRLDSAVRWTLTDAGRQKLADAKSGLTPPVTPPPKSRGRATQYKLDLGY